jgi:hypothetical protein
MQILYFVYLFLYACELAFWLVKITNRASSLSSPNQARPSAVACWLKIKQISTTWVEPSVCLAKIMYIRIILDIKRYATYIPPTWMFASCMHLTVPHVNFQASEYTTWKRNRFIISSERHASCEQHNRLPDIHPAFPGHFPWKTAGCSQQALSRTPSSRGKDACKRDTILSWRPGKYNPILLSRPAVPVQ